MKFTIDKSVILESLMNVARAISAKNVIPVLNGIKFEMTEEGLYLTASDSELTIKSFIDKKDIKNVEATGNIIIQSKFIVDIIRKMPSDIIDFEVVDGLKIKLISGTSECSLNCLDSSEYPIIDLETHKVPIMINSMLFKSIVSQTAFAISTQELRPLLTGLNFKITGNILECIATDSYRLAKKTVTLNDAALNDVNIVIPGKNVLELDKIINDDVDMELHVFNNKVLFKYKNIIFQSNLLAGNYPNTNNLIPTNFEYMMSTNLNDFYNAIDRASLVTQSKDKNIVKMTLSGKKLVINSYASEIGKVEETIDVECNVTNDISISFSAKYMLEALKTFKDEKIMILLNGDIKPIVIKSTEDETLIQLILPIKTY